MPLAARNRWIVLGILFVVRGLIAFQFQSVGAVAPLLVSQLGFDLMQIGFLIGLYFTPGIVLSLPGGAIGSRFGDREAVLAGIVLMLAGQLLMVAADAWSAQVVGRLIAGVGGVLLNVLLAKLVTDWFAGREIATAMAIFINSWPIGIGLSVVALPALAAAFGIGTVHAAVAAVIVAGGLLFAFGYRAPTASPSTQGPAERLSLRTAMLVLIAGAIWGAYNVGFSMIFSFGPSVLAARGWSLTAAGSAVSIVLWLTALSVPIGGVLADRTGRPEAILVVGMAAAAVLMLAVALGAPVIATLIAFGAICGLPAGPSMSLPAQVLGPATRAVGMGAFFTAYYAAMMIGPPLAGLFADWTGRSGAPLEFGAASIAICPLLLLAFDRLRRADVEAAPQR